MDRRLIYAAAFVRSMSVGMTGVFLTLYLAKLGFDAGQVGLLLTAGFAGAAVGMSVMTLWGDRLGRRRTIVGCELLAAVGGAAAALAGSFGAMAAALFLGMVTGMGRGPSTVLDQVILPATAPEAERTRVLAWYSAAVDAGRAIGRLLGGVPWLLRQAGAGELASYRWSIGACAILLLAGAGLYAAVSSAVEAGRGDARPVSPESRRRVLGLSGLFFIDSLGGGFIPATLLSYWFFRRFGLDEKLIAPLMTCASVANAVSAPIAAWLAKRIGLLNTMVFTHIPASLLLVAAALVPAAPLAVALFLLRELLIQMDVPTRQSYVVAVVRPEERTFASGMTNLVRAFGWALGQLPAGLVMKAVALSSPLLIGAGVKIVYDVWLYFAFRRVVPPEESGSSDFSRPA